MELKLKNLTIEKQSPWSHVEWGDYSYTN